jgi:proline iminopeptidase
MSYGVPMPRILRVLSAVICATVSIALGQTGGTIPVDGATLFYREFGSGQPLVIVGGLAGASNDYLVSLAQQMGTRFRTILIDMRGTGGSTITRLDTSNVSPRRVAEDLEALRKHLQIKSWIVVGHAFGGSVALTYAVLFPTGIRALLLVGPTGIDLNFFNYYSVNIGARMSKEDSAMFNEWRNISPWSPRKPKAKLEQFRASLGGYFVDRRHLAGVRDMITERTYVAAVAETYWSAFMDHTPRMHDLLPTLKVPAIIIQGDQDPVDRRTADRIRSALKTAKYKEVRSSGAFPWLERPKDFWTAADLFLKNLRR